MREDNTRWAGLRGFTPRGTRGIVGVVVTAAVAFALGAFIVGGNSAGDEPVVGDRPANSVLEPTVWTCSMHPQIKLPKPGKCPICSMDLIPLDTGSGDDLGPRQLRLSESARQLAQIQTTPVTRNFAEAEIRMVGKIAFDETKVAYITAWVPGRLDRLFADFTGVTVKKGEHLVQMYSPELIAAQEELIQARNAVISLENTSSTSLRTTAEATRVATRDKLRLWGLTKTQIDRIEATNEISDHLTIYSPIGGVVVHKDAKEGMYVDTGTRIYTIADLDKLWVLFEAYESDLTWLRFGQHVEFTSPSFSGERFEAIISFIDPLVDPKTRTVKVRAIVDNKDKKLKPDMFVRGIVKSRIDGEGHIIDEYLADKWISPMHPEIVKDGPGSCPICGMDLVPATSLGFVGTERNRDDAPLLIPASAPLLTGKRAVAYVELPSDDGSLFEGREVQLGPRAGEFYIVKAGLEEGEHVVSNGAFKIDSELQLQAKPSMMSPAGTQPSGAHPHGDTTGKPASQHVQHAEGADAARALEPVYNVYFDIQMALAKDDLESVRKSGEKMVAAVKGVDASSFSQSGHDQWKGLERRLSEQAGRVAGARDIRIARDGFYHLSVATIETHRRFGHVGDRNFYLTHCPMARRGDGAHWLQTEDIVWNSFYGKSMLRCGSIDKTLAPIDEGER